MEGFIILLCLGILAILITTPIALFVLFGCLARLEKRVATLSTRLGTLSRLEECIAVRIPDLQDPESERNPTTPCAQSSAPAQPSATNTPEERSRPETKPQSEPPTIRPTPNQRPHALPAKTESGILSASVQCPLPMSSPLRLWLLRLRTLVCDWLLVRGDFAPKTAITREAALAAHWLIRSGVITVLFGISFFVRWAIAHGVLGPAGRCVMTALVGLVLVAGGTMFLKTRYRLIGEGLAGIGTVVLYFLFYAATVLFGLFPLGAGFTGMVLLTLCAGAYALGLRLPSVATLVAAGGILTPVLLRSETPNIPILYVYLGILAAGIGAGTWWRKWDWLAVLGFTLVWGVTLAAPKTHLSLTWFASLHLLYVLLIFANLIRRGWKSGWLVFTALLANLAILWAAVPSVAESDGDRTVLALVLAAVYALLGALMRIRNDRRMTWCAVLLALVNLGLAATFGVDATGSAFAWCLIAVAAVELGSRVKEPALLDLGQCFGLFAIMAATVTSICGINDHADLMRTGVCFLGSVLVAAHGWWRLSGTSELRSRGIGLFAWVLALPYLPVLLSQLRLPDTGALLLASVVGPLYCAYVPLMLRPTRIWMRRTAVAIVSVLTGCLVLVAGLALLNNGPGFRVPLASVLIVAHLFTLGYWMPRKMTFRMGSAILLGLALTRFAHTLGGRCAGAEAGVIAISIA